MGKEKAIKIKVSLLQLGLSQSQIARDLGVQRSTVNAVINGRRRSKKIEAYIQELLEKNASEIIVRNCGDNIGHNNGQKE